MKKIAAVVINLSKKIDKEVFHYLIPPYMVAQIKIGCRVQVPLGHQICEGYVISFPEQSEVKELKEINQLIDQEPAISQEMVDIALWISEKYLCSLHKVLEYILPPYARIKKEKWVRLVPVSIHLTKTIAVLDGLVDKILSELISGPQQINRLVKKLGTEVETILEDMKNRGLVEIYSDFRAQGNSKYSTMVESKVSKEDLNQIFIEKLNRAPKQREILQFVTESGPLNISQLNQKIPVNSSSMESLIKKELIKKYKTKEQRFPRILEDFKNNNKLNLNNYQLKAVNKIAKQLAEEKFAAFLIHGVTGSGKTEVYLQCIKHTLQHGRGAIVLVPEIALTPQIIGRFTSVLGEQVKVLHSGLSQGERLDVWESLKSGLAKVVVGVRSAIFAPVQNLGLIIIDEEHETTFKQSEPDPRYHARDVALQRAKRNSAVLLLGSATPSVESYYWAKQGSYGLIEMPERVTKRSLPQVEVVDLRDEFQSGNKSIFSRKLQKYIQETLVKGEQIILFLNRRGYSTFVLCRECGKPLQCKNCAISLTYHSVPMQMKCHYCGYTTPVPRRCPHCGSSFIRYFGSGTQQVEEELKKLWPDVKVTRMDVDTTQNKNSHQKLLAEFGRQETNILLGTQMITKGLDFPNVTLVGVIAADASLNFPDYTASERTFQLITQVAGRAGRGEKAGKVVIQTYNLDHYAIITGKKHNYQEFYKQELENRKLMEYPPFSSLIRILVSGINEKEVINCTKKIAYLIKNDFKGKLEILGPAQAPIGKIKNRFRWQLILKGNDLETLRQAARQGFKKEIKGDANKTLRVIIDVEPQSIL